MRKVAGLAVAVVVVLGITGFAFLHAVDAHGRPIAAASASASASASPSTVTVKVPTTTKTYSMTVAGLERSYNVIAPDKGLPESAPIIVFLSGIGATPTSEAGRDYLIPYAASDQVELVYPAGYDDSWNAGGCCGQAAAKKVNDVAFLEALVPKVDPGRARPVYLVGFSNGARLAYRIVCADPGLFDEYAMVKGEPTQGCVMTKPVTILQMASENDPEVPYKPGEHGSVESLPMTTLVAGLHGSLKCPAKAAVTHSGAMTLTTWSDCADGTRLGFAVWPGGKHLFPRPPNVSPPAAAQVIWSFFTRTPIAPLPR